MPKKCTSQGNLDDSRSEWNRLSQDKKKHRVHKKRVWRDSRTEVAKEEARRRDREAKAAKRRSLSAEELREVQRKERESKERRRKSQPESKKQDERKRDRLRQAIRRARLRAERASQLAIPVQKDHDTLTAPHTSPSATGCEEDLMTSLESPDAIVRTGGELRSTCVVKVGDVFGPLAAEDIRVDVDTPDCLAECLPSASYQFPDSLFFDEIFSWPNMNSEAA